MRNMWDRETKAKRKKTTDEEERRGVERRKKTGREEKSEGQEGRRKQSRRQRGRGESKDREATFKGWRPPGCTCSSSWDDCLGVRVAPGGSLLSNPRVGQTPALGPE